MDHKKNLFYLTLEAPREGSASYTHIHEIIKGLKARDWSVQLFKPPYADKAVSPGLVSRLLHSVLLQIKFWLQWHRGTIIYIRAHYLAFPTCLIAKLLGVKVFHEINGPYEDVFITHPSLNKFKWILVPMQKQQFKWAAGLISVTDQLTEYARRESNGVTSITIPNGANTDIFHVGASSPNEVMPEKYTIFFGGLAAWHGVQVMIQALQSDSWPNDVHMVVIGDGPEKTALENFDGKNKHLLHILGRRPYVDIPRYVCKAIVGLVPIINVENRSDTGLFPLKLFETLACGIPAIVTDFKGQADLIRDHHCGIVIPADNAEALATSVKYLVEHPEERNMMGQRAADVIHAHHSWDKRAEATNQFIHAVLQS